MVKPHLPQDYLPSPHVKQKLNMHLFDGLKLKLQKVKGVHFKELTSRKKTLMNVVMSKEVLGVKALARVLNTNGL